MLEIGKLLYYSKYLGFMLRSVVRAINRVSNFLWTPPISKDRVLPFTLATVGGLPKKATATMHLLRVLQQVPRIHTNTARARRLFTAEPRYHSKLVSHHR